MVMMALGHAVPAVLSDRLLRGETVLWWGQPRQGLMLTPRDALLIPFSLMWGGFAIFWESAALSAKAPFPFALFGLPFVCVGLFIIFGRFFVDAWLRRNIVYALTDRRVLISRWGLWPSFRTLELDDLPDLTLMQRSDGSGTIRFGREVAFYRSSGGAGFGSMLPSLDVAPQFLAIENVEEVFDEIQQRVQAAKGR